jgi:hypothetical protein
MTHVEIHLSPNPSDERVILDGEDVSNAIAGIEVHAQAGGRNSVAVRLAAASRITAKGETVVRLDMSTINLLRRAGWTPPEDSHGGMDPITLKRADDEDAPGGPGRGETDEQAGDARG